MRELPKEPIGLVADSHSHTALLLDAIRRLKEMGAKQIIHLGDVCDSLMPEALPFAVDILQSHDVQTVMGNNEYSIITDYTQEHQNGVTPELIGHLKKLPYVISMVNLCFTHSAPFRWPAATRRPITDYLHRLLLDEKPPFKILFRGHSHSPSVIEIKNGKANEFHVISGQRVSLKPELSYIVTVGAVEDSSCALFMPKTLEVQFIALGPIIEK